MASGLRKYARERRGSANVFFTFEIATIPGTYQYVDLLAVQVFDVWDAGLVLRF
jgi:hypothetical protein